MTPEEDDLQVIIACPASYSLIDAEGQRLEGGKGEVRLDEESISILPDFNEAFRITFRDIAKAVPNDYKIRLALASGGFIEVFDLGYHYEDFLRILGNLCNDVLLEDLLMEDSLKKSGVEAHFAYFEDGNIETRSGECGLSLYETALVIIPNGEEPVRIPYTLVDEVIDQDHTLTVTTDIGERFVLSMMGAQFDSVKQVLSDVMNELSLKVQSSLKELVPKAGPLVIRQAARLMREGRAARRIDLEKISPALWTELEKMLSVAGVEQEYEFLKSLGQKERMCIGLKRGLLGDLTGEYIWFLIPIYGEDSKVAGNAIAMESASLEESAGKATYFFRVIGREEYARSDSQKSLDEEVDAAIKNINRCMLAINFRREPVYLSDERLTEPRYRKYQYAIEKIPELKILRKLFIGRIVHSSVEQWQQNVLDLLTFNVNSRDDDEKWRRDSSAGL
ncbi:MAG: hypothetical protein Q7J82_05970 [Coriobacteriia bacterium]|nr:hypothetical protein [Coriobacteriia bacterium]